LDALFSAFPKECRPLSCDSASTAVYEIRSGVQDDRKEAAFLLGVNREQIVEMNEDGMPLPKFDRSSSWRSRRLIRSTMLAKLI
jgi:hypothetical protein